MTVLPLQAPPLSFGGPVNASGTIGGSVVIDPTNFIGRAALFRGNQVTLIPPQPGEQFAFVIALNDNDTALVWSFTDTGATFVLYRDGTPTPINFRQNITASYFPFVFTAGFCRCLNNNQLIDGTSYFGFNGDRAFRLNTRNGLGTILDPFPGDPTENLAWGEAINQAGDVLGYSFKIGRPYHERIGVWGSNGVFYTYLVENESSNGLLFNDNKLIVITSFDSQGGPPISYIVPRPGVRLNLADLVVNLPAGQDLARIKDLNNHGDMIGSSTSSANFLLLRLESGDQQAYATPVVDNTWHALPSAVTIMRGRLRQQAGPAK
ncbi:hypothetical protein PPGU19_094230 (plasmid) [Paraburkholderia sp. PGU19]|uniref:hypothetical protein n=1 Tax=Paraburkholderia sp. PGU19 TaxID=2735434 RepID=UPI0015DAF75B|nr:hypothetical protein [Paraburkholderia sp. PGU19]BCG04855.1 hypothetical protein PPGU19_094230 [Paraburkholderia sp. PGU19]